MELLDVVATLTDLPDLHIAKGRIGTIVEQLDAENVLVEFSGQDGIAVAIEPIPIALLALVTATAPTAKPEPEDPAILAVREAARAGYQELSEADQIGLLAEFEAESAGNPAILRSLRKTGLKSKIVEAPFIAWLAKRLERMEDLELNSTANARTGQRVTRVRLDEL